MSAPVMDAGRELDALVAVGVMGFVVRESRDIRGVQDFSRRLYRGSAPGVSPRWGDMLEIDRYSTDIAAAWLVVERMREEHNYLLKLEQYLMDSDEHEDWNAAFEHRETCAEFSSPVGLFNAPLAAPHAICLAALAAMEATS